MMNFKGWPRYPANFPLKPEHYGNQLDWKRRETSIDEDADHTTIRINSIFLEVADKFYAGRGVLALLLLPMGLVASYGAWGGVWYGVFAQTDVLEKGFSWPLAAVGTVFGLLFGAMAVFLFRTVLSREAFRIHPLPIALEPPQPHGVRL
jgi:hypothetical protein